jgi:hypothetical protein
MRKICIVTGTRAEYGLLYWLMKEVDADPVIAIGMHLSPEFGLTYHQIEADGFTIDAKGQMPPTPFEFPESDKLFHVLVFGPLGFLMVYALSRSTFRLEPRPWPWLRIPPHGRTGRCHGLARGSPHRAPS